MKKVKIIIFTGFTVVAVILLFLVFRGFSQMQPSQPLNQAIAEKELTHNDVLLAAEKKYKISQFYDFNAEEKALVQKFGLESQKDIANPRGSGDQGVYVQTNLFN